MKKIINRLRAAGSKHVVIIGDIMLDEYSIGSVGRISPEAPVPVLKEESREWCLGGAANVAANCKHIGCDVSLIGVIGASDSAGDRTISMLHELKVSTAGIVRSHDRVTTHKKRFLAKNHQLLRMDSEADNELMHREYIEVIDRIDALLRPGSVILVSDYAKGVATPALMAHVVKRSRDLGCTVLVDPKGPDFKKYYGVDYIKPNAKEFAQMVSFFQLPAEQNMEENGRALCQLLALKGLMITLGEKGIMFVSPELSFISPGNRLEVFDLTGAGDTVFAFLALGLAHDLPMKDCLRVANRAAAVAVSHLKTYAVSLDEIVDRSLEPTEKIYYDWAPLKIELDWQRADGKRVILTNGCFDILHPGHIHTLKEAKKLGDILVVALNTDASVQRLKGPSRPVNNLEYRATMMSAIGFVDFVVAFDQDTPQALIEYLRPDVLVKGGDYKRESIVGYDIVTSYGGDVFIIDYVPGVSTTGFIERLIQAHQN